MITDVQSHDRLLMEEIHATCTLFIWAGSLEKPCGIGWSQEYVMRSFFPFILQSKNQATMFFSNSLNGCSMRATAVAQVIWWARAMKDCMSHVGLIEGGGEVAEGRSWIRTSHPSYCRSGTRRGSAEYHCCPTGSMGKHTAISFQKVRLLLSLSRRSM